MYRLLVKTLSIFIFILCAWSSSPVAFASVTDPAEQLKEVGIAPSLGGMINLDTNFTNELGQQVTLRSLMIKNRPLIIVPAYYTCPRLCGMLLEGVTELLNAITLKLGTDFSVITVSFDPEDTTEAAAKKAEMFRSQLVNQKEQAASWHFLTGSKENIGALMSSLGFQYRKDEQAFSHTAAIFLITPNGVLSQYFAAISFVPKEVRYGLVEASRGAIGSVIDQVFLFCFNYDHIAGKYVWAAFGIMRIGGVLTLSFLSFLIYRLYKAEQSRKDRARSKVRLGEEPQ